MEVIRGAFGIVVWLTFAGLLLVGGLYVLYLIAGTLKSLFPMKGEERFSLSREIEKFKRKRRARENLRKEDLVRSYILSAVNTADIETVEKIVREVKKEIERKREDEERWRDEWSKERRESLDDVGWYTTVNAWSKR